MTDYQSDRRLFHAMCQAGWKEDAETGGFTKGKLWVSWQQAEDALRLADDGEEAVGIKPANRVIERATHQASNDAVQVKPHIVNPEALC